MFFKCSTIWQLISTFDVVYNLIYVIKPLILDLASIHFIITYQSLLSNICHPQQNPATLSVFIFFFFSIIGSLCLQALVWPMNMLSMLLHVELAFYSSLSTLLRFDCTVDFFLAWYALLGYVNLSLLNLCSLLIWNFVILDLRLFHVLSMVVILFFAFFFFLSLLVIMRSDFLNTY